MDAFQRRRDSLGHSCENQNGRPMRNSLPVLLITCIFLAGCSTRANPVNWFGGDAPDESVLEPIESTNPLIPESTGIFEARSRVEEYFGTPVDAVSDLALERVPGGLIIRATGQSSNSGAFNARLTPADADEMPEDGVLTYRLEAENGPPIAGAPALREIIVARQLTDQELSGTRTIRVEASQNALQARR